MDSHNLGETTHMEDYKLAVDPKQDELHESKSEPYRETFFIVPRYIVELPGLTFSYLKVYEAMFQFWNKGRNCWISEASLIERTGTKRTQMYEALKFFESNGLLQRKNINGRRYLIPVTPIADSPNVRKTESNVRKTEGSTFVKTDHNIKKGNKENINNKKLNKKKNDDGTTHEVSSCTKKNKEVALLSDKKPRGRKKVSKRPLSQMDLESMNPHRIPSIMISDWLLVREAKKAPVTITAWSNLNKQLERCESATEAFEIMVANGWTSLKADWLKGGKKDSTVSDELKSSDWCHRI